MVLLSKNTVTVSHNVLKSLQSSWNIMNLLITLTLFVGHRVTSDPIAFTVFRCGIFKLKVVKSYNTQRIFYFHNYKKQLLTSWINYCYYWQQIIKLHSTQSILTGSFGLFRCLRSIRLTLCLCSMQEMDMTLKATLQSFSEMKIIIFISVVGILVRMHIYTLNLCCFCCSI